MITLRIRTLDVLPDYALPYAYTLYVGLRQINCKFVGLLRLVYSYPSVRHLLTYLLTYRLQDAGIRAD